MYTNKRKVKPKRIVSFDFAKKIGEVLPYGAKEKISERIKCRKHYVRFVLSGNGKKNLTTVTQFNIVSIAVEILNAQLMESKEKIDTLNNECQEIENLINQYNSLA
jgi:hypothetical protein